MKAARFLSLALAAVALVGMGPGKVFNVPVSFTTADLPADAAMSLQCVKVVKAGRLGAVACNCHIGTVNLTILKLDLPTTATIKAHHLAEVTGCTARTLIKVGHEFISDTTPNRAEMCIQAVAVGGEAAVECEFRGKALPRGKP